MHGITAVNCPGGGMVISECGKTVFKFVWLFGGLDEDFCVLRKNCKRKVTKGINKHKFCAKQ